MLSALRIYSKYICERIRNEQDGGNRWPWSYCGSTYQYPFRHTTWLPAGYFLVQPFSHFSPDRPSRLGNRSFVSGIGRSYTPASSWPDSRLVLTVV